MLFARVISDFCRVLQLCLILGRFQSKDRQQPGSNGSDPLFPWIVGVCNRSHGPLRADFGELDGLESVGSRVGCLWAVRIASCARITSRSPAGPAVGWACFGRGPSFSWLPANHSGAAAVEHHSPGMAPPPAPCRVVVEARALESGCIRPDSGRLACWELVTPGTRGSTCSSFQPFSPSAVRRTTAPPWRLGVSGG